MNKAKAYNIATQFLSDCQDIEQFDKEELEEMQEAINVLYDLKKKIRVYFESPISSGFEKEDIKLFDNKKEAEEYAQTLLEKLYEYAEQNDDRAYVIIEDIEEDYHIKWWYSEDGSIYDEEEIEVFI